MTTIASLCNLPTMHWHHKIIQNTQSEGHDSHLFVCVLSWQLLQCIPLRFLLHRIFPSFSTLSDFIGTFNDSTGNMIQVRVDILNNKVNMFTQCYIEKRVGTCTCILVYTNVAFLASYMAILTDCLLFLDMYWFSVSVCRGNCPFIILSFCYSLY